MKVVYADGRSELASYSKVNTPPLLLTDGAKGNSVAEALTSVTQKQLDKKFKHASDFGVVTTKKNPETLAQYESAIKNHMGSTSTTQQGTYGFVKDSKVFFNSTTNNAVVLDASGNFVTGFKLSPGTQQFENFIKNGVLR
ncbi:adhesin [Pseudomonas sp. ADAK18]|nr:adhesin [Pseudomonas sp. ADAK18]